MGCDARGRWTLYLLRCRDGALYTGITTDLARRVVEHGGAGGRGARALRGRGPLAVVYAARLADRAEASRAERLIKRLPKRAKEALVARQLPATSLRAALGLAPPAPASGGT